MLRCIYIRFTCTSYRAIYWFGIYCCLFHHRSMPWWNNRNRWSLCSYYSSSRACQGLSIRIGVSLRGILSSGRTNVDYKTGIQVISVCVSPVTGVCILPVIGISSNWPLIQSSHVDISYLIRKLFRDIFLSHIMIPGSKSLPVLFYFSQFWDRSVSWLSSL